MRWFLLSIGILAELGRSTCMKLSSDRCGSGDAQFK